MSWISGASIPSEPPLADVSPGGVGDTEAGGGGGHGGAGARGCAAETRWTTDSRSS